MFLETKPEGEVVIEGDSVKSERMLLLEQRTWRDVMCEAADILERDGWCRNFRHRYDAVQDKSLHCVGGAIDIVDGAQLGQRSVFYSTPAREAFIRLNGWAQHMGYDTIVHWNDSGAFNGATVIALLRRLAANEQ